MSIKNDLEKQKAAYGAAIAEARTQNDKDALLASWNNLRKEYLEKVSKENQEKVCLQCSCVYCICEGW